VYLRREYQLIVCYQDTDVFLIQQEAQLPVKVRKLVGKAALKHIVLGRLGSFVVDAMDLDDDLRPLIFG
jgi:hypothetical protein